MFKPHDKLFLNDMSNIMKVEEQMTQRSLDGNLGNNTTQGANQLQSTLILDAEDDIGGKLHNHNKEGLLNKDSSKSLSADYEEDTIAGMLNSGSGLGKPTNLQFNMSGTGENMISFDASRISPNHANNLDMSTANTKNMLGQLAHHHNRLSEDNLTDPEE